MTELFKPSDSFTDWKLACVKQVAQATEQTPEQVLANCPTCELHAELALRTDVISEALNIMRTESQYVCIAIWVGLNALSLCNTTLREQVLQLITEFDVGTACWIWLHIPLTDEEAQILNAAFIAKMPAMARRIASGQAVRAEPLNA